MTTFSRTPSPATLRAWASAWSLDRELDNNLPLGLALRLGADAPYVAGLTAPGGGAASGLATLTALELSLGTVPEAAAEALVDDLDAAGVDLPGVHGPAATSRRVAEAWVKRRGVGARRGMHNNFYGLAELQPIVRAPSGSWRPATDDDVELAAAWFEGFARDADLPPFEYADMARHLIDQGDLVLWLDPAPVSMAALSGRTPRTARVGYVYTPPDRRGRGYGAAATVAAVERARATGVSACCLFADVENGLTNRLYRRLGFVHRFETVETIFE
ncbi:MAG: GNAT family N-acetyltransferase [Acidobacteriota bacterium]